MTGAATTAAAGALWALVIASVTLAAFVAWCVWRDRNDLLAPSRRAALAFTSTACAFGLALAVIATATT